MPMWMRSITGFSCSSSRRDRRMGQQCSTANTKYISTKTGDGYRITVAIPRSLRRIDKLEFVQLLFLLFLFKYIKQMTRQSYHIGTLTDRVNVFGITGEFLVRH